MEQFRAVRAMLKSNLHLNRAFGDFLLVLPPLAAVKVGNALMAPRDAGELDRSARAAGRCFWFRVPRWATGDCCVLDG